MTIRITGMNSGLDTEAIINELASARSVKVQNIQKDQTRLSWKIDAWKELNKKIYSLYSDVISDLRFDYAYTKKTTKVSDPDAVTVLTGGDAMNGVQTLKINSLAKTGYLTGGQLGTSSGEKLVANLDGLAWMAQSNASIAFNVNVGGEKKQVTISAYDNLNGVAEKFKAIGLDAKYDEKNHRFFITSKETGKEANFTMEPITSGLPVLDEDGNPLLQSVPDLQEELTKTWDELGDVDKTIYGSKEAYEKKQADILANNQRHWDTIAENNKIIAEFNKNADNRALGLKEVPDAWDSLDAAKQTELLNAYNAANPDKTLTADEYKAVYEQERQDVIDSNNKLIRSENFKIADFHHVMRGLGLLTEDMAKKYGWGVSEADKKAGLIANKIDGQDAVIELNGATFTSSKNSFEINGLTMTLHKESKDPITLTTEQDTDGIYDTIKNFFVKYNELINEMDKLYNAESASKYEPLTKEEKEALSDTEVEEWEKKIKDSLLRRDNTLSSVANAMKEVMLKTNLPAKIGRNDAQPIYLSYFGIETLGYFKAKDNEKNAYHINGNADDPDVKNYEDKLKKAIATDPDTVIEFFKELANNLYDTLEEKMAKTDYSSAFTVYNDKQMDIELKGYDSKIKKEQDKLNDYIDRWYAKFSQMEVAMSKLNSKESSLSSLFG